MWLHHFSVISECLSLGPIVIVYIASVCLTASVCMSLIMCLYSLCVYNSIENRDPPYYSSIILRFLSIPISPKNNASIIIYLSLATAQLQMQEYYSECHDLTTLSYMTAVFRSTTST